MSISGLLAIDIPAMLFATRAGFARSPFGTTVASIGSMREWVDQFEARTRRFSIDVVRLARALPRDPATWKVVDQLVAAATSVGANHRAMRRARSDKEFASKLFIVHEECDEAAHWLSMLAEISPSAAPHKEIARLAKEAVELRNVFAAARRTMRQRLGRKQ